MKEKKQMSNTSVIIIISHVFTIKSFSYLDVLVHGRRPSCEARVY